MNIIEDREQKLKLQEEMLKQKDDKIQELESQLKNQRDAAPAQKEENQDPPQEKENDQ